MVGHGLINTWSYEVRIVLVILDQMWIQSMNLTLTCIILIWRCAFGRSAFCEVQLPPDLLRGVLPRLIDVSLRSFRVTKKLLSGSCDFFATWFSCRINTSIS